MAQTLETLTRRTDSMQGIRNIVHTMKTLSVINSAPYERAARSIHVYHDTVLDGLQGFLQASGPASALAVPKPMIAARVIVAFGSDHGLCGSYNETIARHIDQHLGEVGAEKTIILCIGAQLMDALNSCKRSVEDSFFPPASVDGIGRLANLLTQRLDEIRQDIHPGEVSVSLAYFARDGATEESAAQNTGQTSGKTSGDASQSGGKGPVVRALLPLDPSLVQQLQDRPWGSRSLPSFAMAPEDLFRSLLRGHLFSSLFKAAAEALVTENAARLSLMQQAERSIDDRLEALRADMRALRQSEITSELLDVVIGFEALRKPKPRKKKEQPTP